jgi:tetratricopeptide (TPR) repeat protein
MIQDEIARQVVSNLKILLSSDSQQILDVRPDLVPEAYDYYLRGRDYLRDSSNDENARSAVELFSKAVALDANYAEAHAGLCDAQLLLYRSRLDPNLYRAAEQHCQRALEIDEEALPVYVALGNLYAESGAYDRAIQEFTRALEINPVAVDALIGLGETYSLDDKPGLAEEAFLRAINVQTADPRSFVAMGNFLFRTGRAEDAIPYYRRITELMPDNAEAFNGLGAAHYMLGQFEPAAAALQRSLQLNPSAIAYSNAGTSLFFLHRFDEAVAMYLKAVEYAPEDFQNWGSLGDAYRYAEGLEELAEPIYRNAIKLADERLEVNPSDAKTMGLVAHYQASVGDREQALQNIARARALAPSNLYVHYNAATAFCALGDREQAALALEQAFEMGYPRDLAAIDANLCSLVGKSTAE